jgi:hypothetical protein
MNWGHLKVFPDIRTSVINATYAKDKYEGNELKVEGSLSLYRWSYPGSLKKSESKL